MPIVSINPAREKENLLAFREKHESLVHALKTGPIAKLGSQKRMTVLDTDGFVLYKYSRAKGKSKAALLIVYALVNRPDIVDLQENRSLVKGLTAEGFEVYLVEWKEPHSANGILGLDDYIGDYLDRCVQKVLVDTDTDKIDLFGVCQGGTFCLVYAALKPELVRNLILTVTPVDFKGFGNSLSKLVETLDFDLLASTYGDIPGAFLNAMFLSLKPYSLMRQKYIKLLDTSRVESELAMFSRMERWIFDSPPIAGNVFRDFGQRFYQENSLILGNLRIGGKIVNLANLTMPILNIFAANDHIVPTESSRALAQLLPSTCDYTELELPGGHIGVYLSVGKSTSVPRVVGQWHDTLSKSRLG